MALAAIRFYRTHLSHLKSYQCACGAMGCPTCSTMGMRVFRRYPVMQAVAMQRQYFEKCRQMSAIFNIAAANDAGRAALIVQQQFGMAAAHAERLVSRAQAYNEEKKEKRRSSGSEKENNDCWLSYCDPGPYACVPISHHGGTGDCGDTGHCDPGHCDVGHCDVGPCH